MTTFALILQVLSFFGIVITQHIYYKDKFNDLQSEFDKFRMESTKYYLNKKEQP